jgi:hypothetical protein
MDEINLQPTDRRRPADGPPAREKRAAGGNDNRVAAPDTLDG